MTDDSYINHGAVDRYTSDHFGAGVTAAVAGVPWWATLGGSIAWELAENHFKDRVPASFPYSSHDSLLNATTDTVAVVLGWGVGRLALRQTTARDRVALDATVGATMGALSVRVISLLGYLASPQVTRQIRRWDNVAAGLGGGIADYRGNRRYAPHRHRALVAGQALLTGVGAAIGGPAVAGVMAYVAAAGAEAVE